MKLSDSEQDSDMEIEHEAEQDLHTMEINDSPQDASEAGQISGQNNPGDSSMLVGYSTMEENTPKEDELDENANKPVMYPHISTFILNIPQNPLNLNQNWRSPLRLRPYA
jgi:hypothetical protein